MPRGHAITTTMDDECMIVDNSAQTNALGESSEKARGGSKRKRAIKDVEESDWKKTITSFFGAKPLQPSLETAQHLSPASEAENVDSHDGEDQVQKALEPLELEQGGSLCPALAGKIKPHQEEGGHFLCVNSVFAAHLCLIARRIQIFK